MYYTYRVHSSLEWLRAKRISFPLPGSFLALCSWPSLWKGRFFILHRLAHDGLHCPSISAHMTTSNAASARTWIIHGWLCEPQSQSLCRASHRLFQSRLCTEHTQWNHAVCSCMLHDLHDDVKHTYINLLHIWTLQQNNFFQCCALSFVLCLCCVVH